MYIGIEISMVEMRRDSVARIPMNIAGERTMTSQAWEVTAAMTKLAKKSFISASLS